ncbi:MAG: M48 family metallopeptidase [Opitutales bacterium]|nr:M48 family metallopeptidase [Opitutales bacterium]
MGTILRLGSLEAELIFKKIKNVHLSVYPPHGRIRITAPEHMSAATVRAFALEKLGWIKSQQRRLREQNRETPREFLEKESHYVWGKRYLLKLVDSSTTGVDFTKSSLIIRKRPEWTSARCEECLEEWYREEVRRKADPLIRRWEKTLGVKVNKLFVQKMRTKWGTCTPAKGYIRLNTELAKKPRECLEYLVVHEMVHLLEPTHNERFLKFMDTFLPQWPALRAKLNRIPVKHEDWEY